MAKELASGDRWKIIDEGAWMYLELHSIYGIVEFKPKSLPTLQLLESIRDNFQRLEALGPIEQASAPESDASQ